MPYKRENLYMIPLLTLALFNFGIERGIEIDFLTVVYMISISVVEEIFFRGILLRFFIKRNKLYGIVVSSVVFAAFHLLNLFRHQDYVYIIMQVLCAFVVGICYAAIVVQYHSLIPCFTAHALTNITGFDSISSGISFECMVGLWVCIAIYAIYAIFLCRKIR